MHADPASHSAHASEKEAELSARKGAGEEGALHCIVIAFPDKGRERGVKRVVKEVGGWSHRSRCSREALLRSNSCCAASRCRTCSVRVGEQ